MSIIQDPAGAGAANVVDAESPDFTSKKALVVAISADYSKSNQTVSNSLTGTANISISTAAASTCGIQVAGTWTGTLLFESTLDGSTWVSVLGASVPGNITSTSTTSNGVWLVATSGINALRVRGSTVGSGTAIVTLSASLVAQEVSITSTTGLTDAQLRASPISVTSSLPSGASTAALQNSINTTLTEISGQLPTTLGAKTTANSVAVNVASDQTVVVSASSLPLPTGAAQDSTLTSGSQKTQVTALPSIPAGTNTIGAVNQGTGGVSAWKIDGSGFTQPVSAASLPLPSGAATSALQTSGNSTLSTISGQLPASLGAKTTSASVAVNIASDQTVPVSGTVVATQSTAANLNATVVGAGIGGTPAGGVLSVQGVASMTALKVDGSGVTQPVSATALPLPTGASTAALQTTGNSTLTAISGQIPSTLGAKTTAASLAVNIASDQTVPVSVATFPLPTGAATSANQTGGGQKTQIVDASGNVQPAGDTVARSSFQKITDGFNGPVAVKAASTAPAATDPSLVVSISPNTPTLPVSASALPLPTGAATAVLQSTISGQLPGTLGSKITSASLAVNIASDQTVPVSASALPLPSGAATSAKQPALGVAGTPSADVLTIQGNASGTPIPVSGSVALTAGSSTIGKVDQGVAGASAWKVDGSAVTQPISAASLPLPTGAATSANLTTLGAQTTKINDGTNTVTVKAASTAAVATDTAIVVAISPNNPITTSGTSTVTQSTAANLNATVTQGPAGAAAWKVDGSAVTQPISGTITANQGSASVTAWKVDGSAVTQPVSGTITASQATAGNLNATVAQGAAGATAWKVDGSAVTQPVSASALPLPAGAATSALQTTGNTSLSAIAGQLPSSLGAKTTANSMAVNIASDQTVPVSALILPLPSGASTAAKQPALGVAGTPSTDVLTIQGITSMTALKVDGSGITQPVSGTFWQTTQPVSAASLPLPIGAATSANLTTIGSQTTKINDGTNTAAVKAASTAPVAADPSLVVAISPNTATLPVSAASLPLPTGAATSALQTTGNSSLSAISGQLPASLGAKTTAASMAVNIASDQNVPVTGTITAAQATAGNLNATVVQGAAGASAWKVDGSAVTQPVSAAALPLPTGAATSANQTTLGSQTSKINDGTYTATIKTAGTAAVTGDTALVVALSPNSSTPNTLDLNNTGTLGSLNATIVFNCSGMSTATFSVTGTWVGTTQFQGSVDGTNWFAADAWNMSTGLFITSITANGNFLVGIAGLKQFRLIMSSYTSGTASIAYNISVRESGQQTGNLIVDANNNGPVTVKQANTAPVATDMALVVAISPNSPTLATSVSSLPLPTGASTAALQTTGNATLTTISGQLPATLGAKTVANSTSVNIASDQTVPVSAAALPLPSGAATSALQTSGNSTLTTISGQLPTTLGTKTTANSVAVNIASDQIVPVSGTITAAQSTAANLAATVTQGPAGASAWKVDGSAVTQPISATALPLPTGAATSANLTTVGSQTTKINDGTNTATVKAASTSPVITDTSLVVAISPNTATLPISAASLPLPSGAATAANLTTIGSQTSKINDGTNTAAVKAASTAAVAADPALVVAISPNNTLNINASALPLPSGASTAALQTSGNSTLTTISSQLPTTLGTKTTANSIAINIASDQTVPVSAIALPLPTGAATSANLTTLGAQTTKINDGTNTAAVKAASTAALATDSALVVAISPNSPFTLPSGASTSANQTTLGSQTTKLNDGTNTVTVKAASTAALATDTALVVAMSPNSPFALPSGASTSSNQITLGAQTTTINDGTNTAAVTAASTAPTATDAALVVAISPNSHINGILKPLYGASGQAMTITLASLTSTSARASTAVDNTTNLFEDVLFFVKTTSAAAATSATGYVNIYGYGSVDGGTTYPEGITGADAAVTLSNPPNLVLLAQITLNANSKTATAGPFSFCRQYGIDRLPARWGLVFVNLSGATLNATAGNHAITWQGINGQLI
jgi:hypothetical protein